MTLTGKLSDFEGDVARINDVPKKMLPAAAKWCNDRLKKGMTIDYDVVEDGEKKGWISKLWERKAYPSSGDKTADQIAKEREDYNAKAAKAGFNVPPQQQGNNQSSCTSPDKPAANGIKTVEGQIVLLDKPAHKITIKTRDGQQHSFVWTPALDAEFGKLNQWWFTKVTGEHEADFDIWRATSQGFFKRPEDWPFAKAGGFGGKTFTPRNEKLIVVQALTKAYCELWMSTNTPDHVSFEDARAEILKAVEADLPTLMRLGGA